MLRIQKLKWNPRLLFWGKALAELKTLNAIVTLFYLSRGVQIEEIFYLSIVFSVTMLLFEVPSGYLADRIGRKKTIMLGSLFFVASAITSFFANGFWEFALVFVFLSLANSSFSGSEEALLYDTLKELGEEKHMTKVFGRIHSARHISKIFLPTIGVFIAKDLLESQFRILIGIDLVAFVSAFILFAFLTEPKHTRHVFEEERGVYRESLETIRRHPFLLKAALNKALLFIVGFMVWRAYQPFLIEHGISVVWLAVWYFFYHVLTFSAHWHVGKWEERFGTAHLLTWSVVFVIGMLLIACLVDIPWLLFLFMLAAMVVTSSREPVFSAAMNRSISSRSRATTLSNLYVLRGMLDIPLMFLAGWLIQSSIENVFLLCIVICAAVLLFFPVRKRDLTATALQEEVVP